MNRMADTKFNLTWLTNTRFLLNLFPQIKESRELCRIQRIIIAFVLLIKQYLLFSCYTKSSKQILMKSMAFSKENSYRYVKKSAVKDFATRSFGLNFFNLSSEIHAPLYTLNCPCHILIYHYPVIFFYSTNSI